MDIHSSNLLETLCVSSSRTLSESPPPSHWLDTCHQHPSLTLGAPPVYRKWEEQFTIFQLSADASALPGSTEVNTVDAVIHMSLPCTAPFHYYASFLNASIKHGSISCLFPRGELPFSWNFLPLRRNIITRPEAMNCQNDLYM